MTNASSDQGSRIEERMTTSHVRPIMPTHATPRSLGNAAFKAQDYRKAIQHYTEVSA
jgi:hypothetical protein